MKLSHVYHLYRRAGFGIVPEDALKLVSLPASEVVERLLHASEDYTPLRIDLSVFDDFFNMYPDAKFKQFKPLIMKTKQLHFKLNKAWLERLCDPSEELNERMTLFWANVFVCKDNVVPYVQKYNNTLRKHALGNFKDFVRAVSKEPAMIKYLNTNRNRKDYPNENFARELMELFTLGVGNYTEKDIKESARAFTGYGFKMDGSFHIYKRQHDYGIKEFMGWKADLDGDDIISIICKQQACAEFICKKLYSYFVNEKPNKVHIAELVEVFYPTYEIKDVMQYLFTAKWFYAEENIGTKIKSPIDLLTSINKVVPYRFRESKEHIYIQRLIGQLLMHPPNVAGWQGGRSWINTNTLMIRLKLPSVFLGNGFVPSSSLQYAGKGRSFGDRLSIKKEWRLFDKHYGQLSKEALVEALCAVSLRPGTSTMLNSTEHYTQRELSLQLMSLPEFQLT